jgi:hypothetical protein
MNDERHQAFFLQLDSQQIVSLVLEELVVLPELRAHAPELECRLNPRDELGGANGFCQEVVTACGKRAIERVHVAERGQKDYRKIFAPWKRPNPFARDKAIHVGHSDVENGAVRRLAQEHFDRAAAVLGENDSIPLVFERALCEGPIRFVVIDHENGGGFVDGWFGHGRFARAIRQN